jgi:hypothetical protein
MRRHEPLEHSVMSACGGDIKPVGNDLPSVSLVKPHRLFAGVAPDQTGRGMTNDVFFGTSEQLASDPSPLKLLKHGHSTQLPGGLSFQRLQHETDAPDDSTVNDSGPMNGLRVVVCFKTR